MSDSFDTWDGPRSVPPTSGRAAHTNPEDDPALLRSELTACRREIERLRSELAEARAELLRRNGEPLASDDAGWFGWGERVEYCGPLTDAHGLKGTTSPPPVGHSARFFTTVKWDDGRESTEMQHNVRVIGGES